MPSLWYHQNKLNKIATRIRDSIQQINADKAEPHKVDKTYLDSLVQDVQNADTKQELKLLENSTNILEEIKLLLRYEEQRRSTAGVLSNQEKKGAVKKGRVTKRNLAAARKTNPYVTRSQSSSGETDMEIEDQPGPSQK